MVANEANGGKDGRAQFTIRGFDSTCLPMRKKEVKLHAIHNQKREASPWTEGTLTVFVTGSAVTVEITGASESK